MSSWHYAFMFPGAGEQLEVTHSPAVLSRFGFEFEKKIRLLVRIDEVGHVLDAGDKVRLKDPLLHDLERRLENREQFSVQCCNKQMFVSCMFATQVSNPHVSFGWSRRLFAAVSEPYRIAFWEMLRDLAKIIKSSYVVIVDDAPDDFEDRFLEINRKRVLDTCVTHSYGHGIQEVWVDESRSAIPPDGVLLTCSADIGRSFRKYIVV